MYTSIHCGNKWLKQNIPFYKTPYFVFFIFEVVEVNINFRHYMECSAAEILHYYNIVLLEISAFGIFRCFLQRNG